MVFYGMEVMVKEKKKYITLSTGDLKKDHTLAWVSLLKERKKEETC